MITPADDKYSEVRIAGPQDEDALMAVARTMHPQAALRGYDGLPLPLDEDMVRRELRRALRHEPCNLPAFIGVVGAPGDLRASIYLVCEVTWYSPAPVLCDRWLYVNPAFRRAPLAATLIDFAKQAADSARLSLHMGHTTEGREAAKERFYRRHLGHPVGTVFVYSGSQAGV